MSNQHHVQEINLSYQNLDDINLAIKRDTNFLASVNIMDYSIPLGV